MGLHDTLYSNDSVSLLRCSRTELQTTMSNYQLLPAAWTSNPSRRESDLCTWFHHICSSAQRLILLENRFLVRFATQGFHRTLPDHTLTGEDENPTESRHQLTRSFLERPQLGHRRLTGGLDVFIYVGFRSLFPLYEALGPREGPRELKEIYRVPGLVTSGREARNADSVLRARLVAPFAPQAPPGHSPRRSCERPSRNARQLLARP